MNNKDWLTAEEARRRLAYDPETGKLTWKMLHNTLRIGEEAKSLDVYGYVQVRVSGTTVKGHRLAWLIHYGEWPPCPLDHINGNPSDNRIENLRLCTDKQNSGNQRPRRDSMPKGVTLLKGGRFQATCAQKYLGLFQDAESAGRAYDAAAIREYGSFACTNYGDQQ